MENLVGLPKRSYIRIGCSSPHIQNMLFASQIYIIMYTLVEWNLALSSSPKYMADLATNVTWKVIRAIKTMSLVQKAPLVSSN